MRREQSLSTNQLFQTTRPLTGLFAGALTIVGFNLYGSIEILTFITAICFAGITGNIMLANDLYDRKNDVRKGKTLAAENPRKLFIFWMVFNASLVAGLAVISVQDFNLALFCVVVWLVVLLYSLTRRMVVINNLIVAVCSAAPILCGAVHMGVVDERSLRIAISIFSIIFARELFKDIEDVGSDVGYKSTIPTYI